MKWLSSFCRFFSEDKRVIHYVPKEDVTAYEVAKCIEIMLEKTGLGYQKVMGVDKTWEIIMSYPSSISRHFKIE